MGIKIHYSEGKARHDLLWPTLCGRFERTATTQIDLITCKTCKKRLEKQPAHITQVITDTLTEEPYLFDDSGLPLLTPETYRKRGCTCGTCPVCKHFQGIARDEFVAPWQDRPRLHKQHTWRWPTVGAALHWYADALANGFPQTSLGEALERIGRTGTTIQGGKARSSQAMAMAEDMAQLEKGLEWAAQDDPELSRNDTLGILFLVTVGTKSAKQAQRKPVDPAFVAELYGISAQHVKNVCKRTRKRLRLYLEGRGMLRQ